MIRGSETALVRTFEREKNRQYYLNKKKRSSERDELDLLPIDHKIVEMTAQGKSLQEMAEIIGVRTLYAVRDIRLRLMQRLECQNSAQLIAVCYQRGILKVEDQK